MLRITRPSRSLLDHHLLDYPGPTGTGSYETAPGMKLSYMEPVGETTSMPDNPTVHIQYRP